MTEHRPIVSERAAWEAVRAKDARWDGRFVYGVRTTGIFCRPSCPSRRPRRENVRFFVRPAEAEAAGFRACRRCAPAAEIAPTANAAVLRARAIMDERPDEPHTLASLAPQVGLTPTQLQRAFTRAVGLSPRAYLESKRMQTFRRQLRTSPSVSRATFESGFTSSSRVYERAGAALGMTPAAYRRGGRGETIRFAIVDASVGRLLVGATERGICSVTLGDDDAALEAALRAEFPDAVVARDDDALAADVAAVVARLDDERSDLAVRLDVRGTAFQWRVWQALQRIPRGETRTYAQVAESLGIPTGARAVARACASNRVALLIPCHRVVRGDGGMGGYRWGIARKEALLRSEREPRRDEP